MNSKTSKRRIFSGVKSYERAFELVLLFVWWGSRHNGNWNLITVFCDSVTLRGWLEVPWVRANGIMDSKVEGIWVLLVFNRKENKTKIHHQGDKKIHQNICSSFKPAGMTGWLICLLILIPYQKPRKVPLILNIRVFEGHSRKNLARLSFISWNSSLSGTKYESMYRWEKWIRGHAHTHASDSWFCASLLLNRCEGSSMKSSVWFSI